MNEDTGTGKESTNGDTNHRESHHRAIGPAGSKPR